MRRALIAAVVLTVAPVGARAADWPKPTPEGEKARDELVRTCVGEVALLLGRPPASMGDLAVLTDAASFRMAVAAHPNLKTLPVRDALVTWRAGGGVPRIAAPLLDVLGAQSRDSVARGFAALFQGLAAEQRHAPETAAEYETAANLFPDEGDWAVWKAVSWNQLAIVHLDGNDFPKALEYHQKALALWQKALPLGHPDIAASLSNIAIVYRARGDLPRALEYFEKALAIWKKAVPPSDPVLVGTLHNIAGVYYTRGELARALEYFEKALALRQKALPPGHPDIAASLTSIGAVYGSCGEDARGLEYFEKALKLIEISRPVGHPDIAAGLHNLGAAYLVLGDEARALEYFTKALALREKAVPPDHRANFNTHLPLASLYIERGDYTRGRKCIDRLTALQQALPRDHPDTGSDLHNIGSLYGRCGDTAQALPYFEKALALKVRALPPGHPDIASILLDIALAHRDLDDLAEALALSDRALGTLRRPSPTGALAPLGLATPADFRSEPATLRVARERAALMAASLTPRPTPGELRAALGAFELAAGVHERFRREALELDDSKLTAAARNVRLLADHLLLCQRLFDGTGDPADLEQALAALERARARVFLDALARSRTGLLAGAPAALRERDLEARIRAVGRNTRTLLDRQALRPDPDFPRLLAQFDSERKQAEADLRDLAEDMARKAPAYAVLKYPRPCGLGEARAALAPDEVALLFAPGQSRSAVLLLDGKPDPADPARGLRVYELPGAETFAGLAMNLTDPETLCQGCTVKDLGAELYGLLLAPLKDRIRGKHLVVVPDGPLCLLPFELLVEDGRYLVETRRVRYAPSLTALHLNRNWEKARPRPDRPLFAIGDPVFGPPDDRLGEKPVRVASARRGLEDLAWREGRTRGDGFPRLAHSGDEVDKLADLLKADSSAVLTGLGATLGGVQQAAADGRLGNARFVHLATHGVLGVGEHQPPALVLGLSVWDAAPELAAFVRLATGGLLGRPSEDRQLRMDEVPGLNLNADLVVLSACRTGRGKLHDGEGVSSMARAFLAAGSRGVVCSLWSVDDKQTARLMVAMYDDILKGQPAAEALRAAKLKLIRDGLPPLYWAPFILQGE